MKKVVKVVFGAMLVLGLAQLSGAGPRDEIAERLTPVGSVCVQGDDCASESASATTVASAGAFDAKSAYDKTCATCHAIGVAGAPKMGDAAAWAPRIEKGMDVLYASAVNGMPPAMPAKGMCFTCSDDDLKAIVDYMVESAQ